MTLGPVIDRVAGKELAAKIAFNVVRVAGEQKQRFVRITDRAVMAKPGVAIRGRISHGFYARTGSMYYIILIMRYYVLDGWAYGSVSVMWFVKSIIYKSLRSRAIMAAWVRFLAVNLRLMVLT